MAVSSCEASLASVAPPPIAWRTSVACVSIVLPVVVWLARIDRMSGVEDAN